VTGVSRSTYAPTAAAIPTPALREKERDLVVDDFAIQHSKRLIRGNQREVGVEDGQVICASGLEEFPGIGR
jgi:hypothetical protein